jgi:hypothetical protein
LTVSSGGAGAGFGLGVDVAMQNGPFMIEHSGEVSGFTAKNMVFPEDAVSARLAISLMLKTMQTRDGILLQSLRSHGLPHKPGR